MAASRDDGTSLEGELDAWRLTVTATRPDGSPITFDAKVRIDTPGEAEYYRHGGILPFVLRQLRDA